MRVTIISRIFEPEPSAASFRLAALAEQLSAHGVSVTVDTVRPWKHSGLDVRDAQRPYRVKRARVIRDEAGYLRGYLPYLSFDLPLFVRVLFGRKNDLLVVEPPPTTGFFVRIGAALRRTPYAYYCADIWSDAASQTGASPVVIRALRAMERWVLRGASAVLAVSPGVEHRLAELGIRDRVTMVGNGVDIERFQSGIADTAAPDDAPAFVYPGTASEWHGAELVVRAYAAADEVTRGFPLRFIGGGSQRKDIEALAESLGVADRVSFEPGRTAEALAPILANSVAAVATLRPESGYDFAFPTKLYSAAACGAPLIFAGSGPARDFVEQTVDQLPIGRGSDWRVEPLTAALNAAARDAREHGELWSSPRRARVRHWAASQVSLAAVSKRAVSALLPEAGGHSRKNAAPE